MQDLLRFFTGIRCSGSGGRCRTGRLAGDSKILGMEQDFRKLMMWLEKKAREQVAIDRLVLEWKKAGKLPTNETNRAGKAS